jgi:GH25 family lysozyme M1 (1,4-beta-N-acetylmuramidase)
MSNALLMIDVSSNNAAVDIRTHHQAGYQVIGVKATEGNGYYWAGREPLVDLAHRLGMTVVHYHFATAGVPGATQAQFFLNRISPHLHAGDILGYDFEGQPSTYRQWGRGEAAKVFNAFADHIHRHGPRFGPLRRRLARWVYGPPYFLRDARIRPRHGERLWVASYSPDHPLIPTGWRRWTAWQFTDKARVPGSPSPVDESHFRPLFHRYPTLRPGATGHYVRVLQHLLNERCHAGLDVDGVFGRQTRHAVNRLKASRGWAADGVAGRRVWRYLTH